MSRRGQKKKFKYTIQTKYSSFLTYIHAIENNSYSYLLLLHYILLLHTTPPQPPTLRKLRPNSAVSYQKKHQFKAKRHVDMILALNF